MSSLRLIKHYVTNVYGRVEVHLHELFQFQMEVGRQLHARALHLRHTRQRSLQ